MFFKKLNLSPVRENCYRFILAFFLLFCALLICTGLYWIVENIMFWIPYHRQVFGVMVVGFGNLLIVTLALTSVELAINICMGKVL